MSWPQLEATPVFICSPYRAQSTLCNVLCAFQVGSSVHKSTYPSGVPAIVISVQPSTKPLATGSEVAADLVRRTGTACLSFRGPHWSHCCGFLSLDIFGLGNARNLLAEQLHPFCFVRLLSITVSKKKKKNPPAGSVAEVAPWSRGQFKCERNFSKLHHTYSRTRIWSLLRLIITP